MLLLLLLGTRQTSNDREPELGRIHVLYVLYDVAYAADISKI